MSRLVAADGVTPLRAPRTESFRANSSYRGADRLSQELAGWAPGLTSPSTELRYERDQLVARTRDLDRNNGFAGGIRHTLIEGVIGAAWRLSAKPNWRVLGMEFDVATKWASEVEAKWRAYADDPGRWIDAARRLRFAGLLRTQFTTWLHTGEHLSAALWLPDRIGKGRARNATTIQLIDPDRLCNPSEAAEQPDLRGGVRLGAYGEPLGYWLRDAHPNDWVTAAQASTWTYVPRETEWGRPVVLHGYEMPRPDMVRGVPPMAGIIESLRMQDVYERSEASAAILNAMFAAVLQTPLAHDPDLAEQQLGATKNPATGETEIRMQGIRVPQLPVGTELKFLNAARPVAPAFAQFEESVLRRIAAGVGLSYEQVARDYSKTNYSSARASLLESWKFLTGRSEFMAESFADPLYALWLEEEIDVGRIVLPKGAPDFYAERAAWVGCRWIGPGRGAIDPTKEAQAAQIRIDTGVSTLEDEAAEHGKDWIDVLEQRAYEQRMAKERGVADTGSQVYQVNTMQPGDRAQGAG